MGRCFVGCMLCIQRTYIYLCLNAVQRQDHYMGSFEVVVQCGHSTRSRTSFIAEAKVGTCQPNSIFKDEG